MSNDHDQTARHEMSLRRNHILEMLATSTFTPQQYAAIYEELAEIALYLGPDMTDMGEAKLYEDVRAHLSDLNTISRAMQDLTRQINRERARWHPKEDDRAARP